MAKDRVQVPDLYKDRGYLPSVRPTATPVDTFSRSAAPIRDTRLAQIAEAFSTIQPGLTRFSYELQDEVNQKDLEEGFAKAQTNKAQFKEAVQKGVIPAGASPWFRVGWERQRAQVASSQYDGDLQAAYAASGLAETDDPSKLQGFVSDFTNKWHEAHPENQDNPEFTRVFANEAAKSQAGLANLHASNRVKKIEADVLQNTDLQLGATLSQSQDLLGSYGDGIGPALGDIVKVQIDNGLSGAAANQLIAGAVIRKAIEDGDVTTLDILNTVPSGSGTVGQIGWVKDAVAQARDQIASRKGQQDRVNHLRSVDERKLQIQGLRAQANAKIFKDPYADISEEFNLLNALDADEGLKLESWRTAYLGSLNAQNKVIENDEFKTGMLLKALKGDLSEDEVVSAVKTRQIDADTAKDLLTNHIPKSKENRSIASDPLLRDIRGMIRMAITKNDSQGEDADILASRAATAEVSFLRSMLEYKTKKPDALEGDVLDYAEKQRDRLTRIYGRPPEITKAGEMIDTGAGDITKSDPMKDKLFMDARELDAAIVEAEASNGTSGKLKALADTFGVDIQELLNAQLTLFESPTQPQPKK